MRTIAGRTFDDPPRVTPRGLGWNGPLAVVAISAVMVGIALPVRDAALRGDSRFVTAFAIGLLVLLVGAPWLMLWITVRRAPPAPPDRVGLSVTLKGMDRSTFTLGTASVEDGYFRIDGPGGLCLLGRDVVDRLAREKNPEVLPGYRLLLTPSPTAPPNFLADLYARTERETTARWPAPIRRFGKMPITLAAWAMIPVCGAIGGLCGTLFLPPDRDPWVLAFLVAGAGALFGPGLRFLAMTSDRSSLATAWETHLVSGSGSA